MRYTLMHVSDLHAGPPFNLQVGEALVEQAHNLRPDVLVASGDFVQRADFLSQWQLIKAFLQRLPTPQFVVPGNHDVPLYNGFRRLFFPLGPYSRHISNTLTPLLELPGLVLVGGSTAHGMTVAGGLMNPHQMARMGQAFAAYDGAYCKVAVLHHPVISPPQNSKSEPLLNERAVARLMQWSGVELILSGHVHFAHADTLDNLWQTARWARGMRPECGPIVQCCAGTTTSRRGRGPGKDQNSFNILTIDDSTIQVQPYIYDQRRGGFVEHTAQTFTRLRR
ncbi:MAG: metallophosphoesterase [Chloroflexaceae bacterium]|nr:metallophosphoesterase [Chloroflexaceae bacterium]